MAGPSAETPFWTVLGAWQTSPYSFSALVRRIHGSLGASQRPTIEAELPSGPRLYQYDEQPTERELKKFKWLRIAGDSSEMRIEVEVSRMRTARAGGRWRGIILRTWPTADWATDAAKSAHDSIAAEIHEGALALAGASSGSYGRPDRSRRKITWITFRRRVAIFLLSLLIPLPIYLIRVIPYGKYLPSELQSFVRLCTCGETGPTYWAIASIAALITSLIFTPRLLPAVRIQSRTRRGLAAALPTIVGILVKGTFDHAG
jgi:hypothetical protein